eukprot:Gregarina_sp_Poly_1__2457@NODE_1665_length_3579_cov_25_509112_g1093_i0_p1_GENE_NODE_1665_length_3579_cov_25_509112_g1093_i0NODE_1665_length_3579_cov_25_509112_g1093_i0_p1_ORF_typecomplete_len1066_score227_38XPG_I/PF00867_18/8_2e21XPG_I_2/PF12813_7/1_1e04XPG_I_2/PF12813_7/7_3e06_NODE_1665_length_3579_cov_25_509112_g1093_i03293526
MAMFGVTVHDADTEKDSKRRLITSMNEFKEYRTTNGFGEDVFIQLPLNAEIDEQVFLQLPTKLQYKILTQLRDQFLQDLRLRAIASKDDSEVFSNVQLESYLRTIKSNVEIEKVKRRMGEEIRESHFGTQAASADVTGYERLVRQRQEDKETGFLEFYPGLSEATETETETRESNKPVLSLEERVRQALLREEEERKAKMQKSVERAQRQIEEGSDEESPGIRKPKRRRRFLKLFARWEREEENQRSDDWLLNTDIKNTETWGRPAGEEPAIIEELAEETAEDAADWPDTDCNMDSMLDDWLQDTQEESCVSAGKKTETSPGPEPIVLKTPLKRRLALRRKENGANSTVFDAKIQSPENTRSPKFQPSHDEDEGWEDATFKENDFSFIEGEAPMNEKSSPTKESKIISPERELEEHETVYPSNILEPDRIVETETAKNAAGNHDISEAVDEFSASLENVIKEDENLEKQKSPIDIKIDAEDEVWPLSYVETKQGPESPVDIKIDAGDEVWPLSYVETKQGPESPVDIKIDAEDEVWPQPYVNSKQAPSSRQKKSMSQTEKKMAKYIRSLQIAATSSEIPEPKTKTSATPKASENGIAGSKSSADYDRAINGSNPAPADEGQKMTEDVIENPTNFQPSSTSEYMPFMSDPFGVPPPNLWRLDNESIEYLAPPNPQRNKISTAPADPAHAGPRTINEGVEISETPALNWMNMDEDEFEMQLESGTRTRDPVTDLVDDTTMDLDELAEVLEEEAQVLLQSLRRGKQRADEVSQEMGEDIRALLRAFGVPYVEAPSEAEAQAAWLLKLQLAEGVLSDDSDSIVFGAEICFRNFFASQRSVELYTQREIGRCLGLSVEELRIVALLLGCDYTVGIKGIGIVNALEVVQAYPTFGALHLFASWVRDIANINSPGIRDEDTPSQKVYKMKHFRYRSQWEVPFDFPSREAYDAFVNPRIDKSTEPFSWAVPDVQEVVALMRTKAGMSEQQTMELLQPVVQRMKENVPRKQLLMDIFLHQPEEDAVAVYKSQRLKRTVQLLKSRQHPEPSAPQAKRRAAKKRAAGSRSKQRAKK